jgi:hypothetical protein
MSSEEVKVDYIPVCDLCADGETIAVYDAKTIMGPWAYMCAYHFRFVGVGLGTGKGQRLILPLQSANTG